MKKYIIFIFLAVVALTGCRNTYQTFSGGKENESFILITTDNPEYRSDIAVIIDNNAPVIIEKVFTTKKQLQAKPVVTTPGQHSLKVLKGSKVILEENVYLGLQETKKIVLR